MTSENMELHDGQWRPSVPLPLIGPMRVRCQCGKRFWRRTRGKSSFKPPRYEAHYRQVHLQQAGSHAA